jgi:hypothetical protein
MMTWRKVIRWTLPSLMLYLFVQQATDHWRLNRCNGE